MHMVETSFPGDRFVSHFLIDSCCGSSDVRCSISLSVVNGEDPSFSTGACNYLLCFWFINVNVISAAVQENVLSINQMVGSKYRNNCHVDLDWLPLHLVLDLTELDSLEKLHLKDCTLEVFELVGKGMLRFLKIDDVSVIHLDIGESAENLEIVDVSNFTIMWAKFHHMISRSAKLRKLRLWGVVFDDDDELVDIETISSCFPLLSHLSLSYDLREAALQYGLQGSFVLENVIVLELGWTVINDLFSTWVSGLLERCPHLKKLVIHGVVSETKTHEECNMLANFTSSIVKLMRKYMHVELCFVDDDNLVPDLRVTGRRSFNLSKRLTSTSSLIHRVLVLPQELTTVSMRFLCKQELRTSLPR
ncbi:F-box/LRR-repeat protein [Sesamum angolense]|uniref:F-box/LRR-repeat protein n=1 Tax=Sesamum angolense TaxID=2727404 RepID=A0AAE2BSU9_9LAMI|nr:F-box/LRR-repeat protein [Sesamum angolense]